MSRAGLVLSLGVACAACSPIGAPCAGLTCGTGYECLANRCEVPGGIPVPRDSERIVLSPIELAVTRDGRPEWTPSVTLGSAHEGDGFVFARFGSSYKGRSEIAAAFLLLTVSPDAEPLHGDLPLEVWTLTADWSAESVSLGRQPGFARPMARGIARSSPPSTIRVDVTDLVRGLARTPGDDGIGILCAEKREPGVTLMTFAAGAPRLEVYLARPRVAGAAW